ncbi:MAG: uroporphyrinogen decarboxylase family protein [Anaerolineae bacterium]
MGEESIVPGDRQAWLDHFWAENARCRESHGTDKPHIAVSVGLNEDWVKYEAGVTDHRRFHTDFAYQQEMRRKAGEIAQRELGIKLGPAVNLGSVTNTAIYGGEVVFPDNAGPWLLESIEDPPRDVPRLIREMGKVDVLKRGIVPTMLEWRQRILEEYGVELKYGTGCHGLATLGSIICGTTNFIYWLYDYPDQMDALMQLFYETNLEYMVRLREATGAPMRGMGMGNDNVAFLTPDLYRKYCLKRERDWFDYFSTPGVESRSFHSDSENTHMLEVLNELELSDVNLGPTVDVSVIKRKMPKSVIRGQMPPFLLREGTVAQVLARAKSDIEKGAADGGMVLDSAGSINDGTPHENVRAMMRAAELYGRFENGELVIVP